MKQEKTNVMRLLDKHGISYRAYSYSGTGALSGTEVAEVLHQPPAQVFKTLVTVGGSGGHFVFLVPVAQSLSLKKAARAVHEISIEMLPSKQLLPLTGYIHGGCSPLGMKKQFPTVIDASARHFDTILFSGGKIGFQVELALSALQTLLPFSFYDICEPSKATISD